LEENMDAKVEKCPIIHGTTNLGMRSNSDWWPNQLNLKILHQNSSLSDPMGEAFNYAEEFKKLDFKALKKDLASATGAAARAPASSASHRSTLGRIMRTSTRRAGSCGRSSRNTATRSRGPIS
jgi:catalase (peroxidase I)